MKKLLLLMLITLFCVPAVFAGTNTTILYANFYNVTDGRGFANLSVNQNCGNWNNGTNNFDPHADENDNPGYLNYGMSVIDNSDLDLCTVGNGADSQANINDSALLIQDIDTLTTEGVYRFFNSLNVSSSARITDVWLSAKVFCSGLESGENCSIIFGGNMTPQTIWYLANSTVNTTAQGYQAAQNWNPFPSEYATFSWHGTCAEVNCSAQDNFFRFTGLMSDNGDYFYIDNLNITVTTVGDLPPNPLTVSVNATYFPQAKTFNFNASWQNDTPLSTFIFSNNQSGTWLNVSNGTFASRDNSEANLTLTANAGTIVGWMFFANTTAGFNQTPVQTLTTSAYCIVPVDHQNASNSILLCNPGNAVYQHNDSVGFNGSITATASNIIIDCNGATLKGNFTPNSEGINTNFNNNITIQNCNITGYSKNIHMRRSNMSKVSNNYIGGFNTNTHIGLDIDRSENATIEYNYFYGFNYTNTSCTYARCINTTGVAIQFESNVNKRFNVIRYNNFTLVYEGIFSFTNNSYVSIYGNNFSAIGSNGYGIEIKPNVGNTGWNVHDNFISGGHDSMKIAGEDHLIHDNIMNAYYHHGPDTLWDSTVTNTFYSRNLSIYSNNITDDTFSVDPDANDITGLCIYVKQTRNSSIYSNNCYSHGIGVVGNCIETDNINLYGNFMNNTNGTNSSPTLRFTVNGNAYNNYIYNSNTPYFDITTGADPGNRSCTVNANIYDNYFNNPIVQTYFFFGNYSVNYTNNSMMPLNITLGLPGGILANYTGYKAYRVNNESFQILNLSSPFDDVRNSSNGVLLGTNVAEFNVTLSPNQQVEVGDFGSGSVNLTAPVNNAYSLDSAFTFGYVAFNLSAPSPAWCAITLNGVVINNKSVDLGSSGSQISVGYNINDYGTYDWNVTCKDALTGQLYNSSTRRLTYSAGSGGSGGGGSGGANTPAANSSVPPVQVPDVVIIEKPTNTITVPGFDVTPLGSQINLGIKLRLGNDDVIRDYSVDSVSKCVGSPPVLCQVLDSKTVRVRVPLTDLGFFRVFKSMVSVDDTVVPVTLYDLNFGWFLDRISQIAGGS